MWSTVVTRPRKEAQGRPSPVPLILPHTGLLPAQLPAAGVPKHSSPDVKSRLGIQRAYHPQASKRVFSAGWLRRMRILHREHREAPLSLSCFYSLPIYFPGLQWLPLMQLLTGSTKVALEIGEHPPTQSHPGSAGLGQRILGAARNADFSSM